MSQSKSTGPKRKPSQILKDSILIEKWALEGYNCREIAEKLNDIRPYSLSAVTVYQDLKKLMAQWKEETTISIDERVAQMLKRIDKRRKELEKAWKRSQRAFESITKKTSPDGLSITRVKEERDGQVAFINALSDLDRQERELLGLDKPTKTALTDITGTESFQPLVVNISNEDMPKKRKE